MQTINTQMIERNGELEPVHRFRLFVTDPQTGEQKQSSYPALWEQGVKAHSAFKNGMTVEAQSWDKVSKTFVENTDEAVAEGLKRAERAKGANKSPTAKEPKPSLPIVHADGLRAHAELIKLIATEGRKNGVSEANKTAVGMSAMEALTHVGYTPDEIKALATNYLKSLKAQENGNQ